ncbi:hypothetical protein AQUCO_03500131v1 [Aquilegia coerulea]|uniref:DUF4005 domain-containing protein n=1 Tax=Aquilegia coerulea TaxID=218851 RepID=A0A2G5CWA0_AQUCA|nr:hypothetical protein AQUCO_03500131v1 [Aquilegia coerulea]
MKVYWQWVGIVRRKFRKSSHQRIIIVNQINDSESFGDAEDNNDIEEGDGDDYLLPLKKKKELSKEDIAAITIQACFRAYLARRAFIALRSLVKLQALVRGVQVRRQSRIALHCMHALVRLQVTIRARQLLSTAGNV